MKNPIIPIPVIPVQPNNKNQTDKQKLNKTRSVWDPAHEKINHFALERAQEKLNKKYEKYKKNPRLPLKNLLLLCIPIFIEIILLILFPSIFAFLNNSDSDSDSLEILVLPFLPAIAYYTKILFLQRDLIKLIIAKENNWLYSPDESPSHWRSMVNLYPEFFRKGNKKQNLQDEFWGKFNDQRYTVDFWTGIFEYTVKSRKKNIKFKETLFALHLNKKLKTDLRLVPETTMNRFWNFFRKNEINTESAEFNQTFATFYAGTKLEKEMDIIRILTPAVQVKLLDLKKSVGQFSILFRGETLLFAYKGPLLSKMHTNFFKKVEVDPRDREAIRKRLNDILDISSDIIQYLD